MELILHNNDIHIITMHLHAGLPLLSFLFSSLYKNCNPEVYNNNLVNFMHTTKPLFAKSLEKLQPGSVMLEG